MSSATFSLRMADLDELAHMRVGIILHSQKILLLTSFDGKLSLPAESTAVIRK